MNKIEISKFLILWGFLITVFYSGVFVEKFLFKSRDKPRFHQED